MKWADQLIKITTFEVELLQKRLSEIVERRVRAEMRMAVLVAEGEVELMRAREDVQASFYLAAFQTGLKQRKAQVQAEIDEALQEEAGARDALSEAFEAQKKYEQSADNARQAERREADRRETAALDEIGLRKVASGRG